MGNGSVYQHARVLDDIVWIVKDAQTELSSETIVLPETLEHRTHLGHVVAVGPGKKSRKTGKITPMEVQLGDRVIFNEHIGESFEYEGERLYAIREPDIQAIVS